MFRLPLFLLATAFAGCAARAPSPATRPVPNHQQACSDGQGSACYHAGLAYQLGWEVEKDSERSAALYRKGCELGDPDCCRALEKKQAPVTSGERVKGCLSQKLVGSVIGRTHNRVKVCYERGLRSTPNLAGKVVTRFIIDPIGRVTHVKVVDSDLGHPAVEQCILEMIAELRFPPCDGGGTADVTYPWIFRVGSKPSS